MSNAPASPPAVTGPPSRPPLWQAAALARAARHDPGSLIEYCFADGSGRPVRQAPVHAQLQDFLTRHPKALVELPRDHGKSFQVCGRILWELGKNPALRVKVVCATDAVAAERARFLRDAVRSNQYLRAVFPDLRPGRPWAADAFAVRRPADLIGPTVAAFGVGAGSTGTRADLLVCDDIVDVRALHSKADRDRVADDFRNNLLNLLEPDGRFWGLCTPWHADDLNARLKRERAFALFRRAVGDDLQPVWAEKWPAEKLAERRAEVGAAAFARGYRLVPVAPDDTPIRPEWVRYWTEPGPVDGTVLSVDPAVSAKATADASALVVLGRRGATVDVLAAVARRVPAPGLVALIDEVDRQWTPDLILFETNAAFEGIKDLLVAHARFGPRVRGVTQSKDKAVRAAALGVAVEAGLVRLKGDGAGGVDPGQAGLRDEMVSFPAGEHDDLLDAAATGAAYLLARREPRAW